MRRRFLIISLVLSLLVISNGFAQEASGEELDEISLDSIDDLFSDEAQDESADFDEPSDIAPENESDDESDETLSLLEELTTKAGFSFKASYAFAAGYAPGWSEALWYWDDYDQTFTDVIGVDLTSAFALDFQLSPQLRVYQSFSCDFSDFNGELDTFWAEYNMQNKAFFKLGLYEEYWGLSRNYSYTNLLNRLPEESIGGDAYTLRTNLPIGVGGLQLLTMVRSGFADEGDINNAETSDLGYGVKYNFAHPLADINIGMFYHDLMPLRMIGTLKTTLFDSMEVYTEGLVAFPYEDYNTDYVASGSIGFIDKYINERLTVNAEYFYNGEVYTNTEESDEGWTEDEESPFVKGHNATFNLYYNLGIAHINLFSRLQYNFSENTGKWAPGFRITPFDDLTVILSCPIAIGDRDGTYYSSNYDENNRPFSVTLAVILSGNYKFASYDE